MPSRETIVPMKKPISVPVRIPTRIAGAVGQPWLECPLQSLHD
jgi:hypothetical protein